MTVSRVWLVIVIIMIVLGSSPVFGSTTLASGTTISTSATWNLAGSPYIITGPLYIASASSPILTIQSGVTVQFNSGAYFQVGNGNPGGVIAVGASGSPVVFTGTTPSPGQWAIFFNSQTISTAALFDNCLMQYGGEAGAYTLYANSGSLDVRHTLIENGAGDAIYAAGTLPLFSITSCTVQNYTGNGVNASAANPTITNCLFQGLGAYGIYLAAGTGNITNCTLSNITSYGIFSGIATISNCSINNTGNYPLSLDASVISSLTTVTLTNITTKPGIEVRGGTVLNSGTWLNFNNMPYVITNAFFVDGVNAPILTFLSGQTITFANGQYIQVGNGNPGGLIAAANPGNSIVFTGNTKSPGQWAIFFNSQTISTAALFDNCLMQYGGEAGAYTLYANSGSLDVRHTLIQNGNGDAIYASGTLPLFNISSCTVQNYTGNGVNASAANPTITNCLFQSLGGNGIYLASGTGNITNCTLSNITSYGIFSGIATITNCTISNTGNYPLSLDASVISSLTTVTLTNITTKPGIEIRGGTVANTGTWLDFNNMPYVITNSFNVDGVNAPILTFLSGQTITFASGQNIDVGNGGAGGIIAVGNPGNPIIFTGNTKSPGQWAIFLYGGTSTALFDNCVMEYGGYANQYCLYVSNGSLDLRHTIMRNGSGDAIIAGGTIPLLSVSSCTIQNFTGYGIDGPAENPIVTNCVFQNIGNEGVYATLPTVQNCTFSNISSYPISCLPNAVVNLSNNSFSQLLKSGFEIRSGTLSTTATWANQSIPYVINGTVQIYQSSGSCTLTLSPGVVMKFDPSSYLYIGGGYNTYQGGLIAQGSGNTPIYFTSVKDDSVGGDSNGDGGATVPLPGDWGCLIFNSGTTPSTILDYCIIEYGGQTYAANIYCTGGQPLIRRCQIINSSGSGIYSSNGNAYIQSNSITNNQTNGIKFDGSILPSAMEYNNLTNNPIGFYADAGVVGILRDNNISGNSNSGGQNIITTKIVDAKLNWWGDTSGPYDGSTIGLYNPTGLGNAVTDYIDYSDWLSSNPLAAQPLPAVKLLAGEIISDVLDLKKYSIDSVASWTDQPDPFLDQSRLTINLDNTVDYTTTRTPGFVGEDTILFVANSFSTTTSITKYSTYRINKLPKIGLNIGSSYKINIAGYTNSLATSAGVIAQSYGNNQSISVSDPTHISASWLNDSILQVQALSGFTSGPVSVYVIASPNSGSPFGSDLDKEQILVYPNLLAHSTFSTANDTTSWSPLEMAPGRSVLAAQSWVSTYTDIAGTQATGVWQFNFPDASSGVKSTPTIANWIHVTAGQWYILRMRIVDDTPNNTDQSLLFGYTNYPGGGVQTDIAANILFGIPTVWTWQETPMLVHGTSSTGYPQFQIKANSAGNVYVDEIQIINAAPALVNARSNTRIFYPYGVFDLATETTGWGQELYAGSGSAPTVSVSNISLELNFSGASSGSFGQKGIKWTANNGVQGPGNAYTYPVTVGKQVGVRATLSIVSGSFDSLGIVLVAAYGVQSNGQQAIALAPSDLVAAAGVGILTPGLYQTVGAGISPYYQFQFGVRSDVPGVLAISGVDFDHDQDDPNFGDAALFP